jgi:TfoX/Sxy family transcriptional regulator of competence genes
MDNHITAERIADILLAKNIVYEQKRMFGGVCFMLDDKMCLGTYKNGLMARVGPEAADMLAERPGASQMMHAGRTMVGYLFIESEGYERDSDLSFWVEQCLAFNPKVKKAKKKV